MSSANGRAAAISRVLTAAGIRALPSGTPRHREGVRVSRGIHGTTHVTVAIDARGERGRMAEDVVVALRDAGYTVTDTGGTEFSEHFTVTRHDAT